MKRLAVRTFPEKVMMAAIILSCGLVLHAEPSARLKAKRSTGAEAGRWHAASQPPHQAKAPAKVTHSRLHHDPK